MIAYVNGFLEPVDFRGHLVTVVEPITGVEAGKIGMTPYDFVVINATGYKRWNLAQQVMMPPQWALGVIITLECGGRDGVVGTIQGPRRFKLSLRVVNLTGLDYRPEVIT